MALIPGLEGINWAPYAGQMVYWIGYGMVGLTIVLLFFAAYHYLSFNINVTVYPIYGSGKDGIFSVGKPKTNKVKWIKKRTAWRSCWPLFNRKDREPFDSEYVYPGNRIIAFELNGEWFPGRVSIEQSEGKLRAQISPVPYWIRNWQSLEHKQNAIEFTQHNFWEDNKVFIWMVIAVGLCCALCAATIYFTYQFAGGGTASMDRLTEAIHGMTQYGNRPAG